MLECWPFGCLGMSLISYRFIYDRFPSKMVKLTDVEAKKFALVLQRKQVNGLNSTFVDAISGNCLPVRNLQLCRTLRFSVHYVICLHSYQFTNRACLCIRLFVLLALDTFSSCPKYARPFYIALQVDGGYRVNMHLYCCQCRDY